MKTVQQIQNDINAIASRLQELAAVRVPSTEDRTEAKRLTKKLNLLRERKMYVESNPTEGSLIEQRNRITLKLEKIKSEGESRAASISRQFTERKRIATAFAAEYEAPKLEAQLDTLNYLLSV